MAKGKDVSVVVKLHSRVLEMSEEERRKWLREGIKNRDPQALGLMTAISTIKQPFMTF
jgi:hypothetical protein